MLLTSTAFAQRINPEQRLKNAEQRAKIAEQRLKGNTRQLPAKAPPSADSLTQWAAFLPKLRPADVLDYADQKPHDMQQAVDAVEQWAADLARFEDGERPGQALLVVKNMLAAKSAVDQELEAVLAQRTLFVERPENDRRHQALRNYLRSSSALIDLSGRLRYLLFDALNFAVDIIVERADEYDALVDALIEHRSGIGAIVAANGLFDPPPNNSDGAMPIPAAAKFKILRLIGDTGQYELLPELARLIRNPNISPRMLLAAADSVRRIGLPQAARPNQDGTLPKPAITANELHALLVKLDVRRFSPDDARGHAALVAWLADVKRAGIVGDTYRLGTTDVRPGDWLLMRNPSPYNLFTDLSPGLFTHVGIATIEKGSDGIRRMVIVDIPERGAEMPATNIDAFVQRTRHFVLMRHPNVEIAQKMAEAATTTIGSPTEFDLQFETDRVLPLKGQPLAGKKIHTYCAGYLYVCALQTGLPREEFFPLRESPATGGTRENLAKFGFTLGLDLISPTGAFFSNKLLLVGRREPMYDAGREIEEAVFNHFALRLIDSTVTPAPDAFQALRLKVAEASKTNPALAAALANAVGVAAEMDLVAAAKAKAMVETLDEIAYAASGDYVAARNAVLNSPNTSERLDGANREAAQRAKLQKFRTRHADLVRLFETNRLAPRTLRIELVRYYIAEGKRNVDARFFKPNEELNQKP